MRPVLPRLLLLAVPMILPLGACTPEATLVPAAALTGASLVFTGKTPLDHVAGLVSGEDCSAVRWERHGPWCAPRPGPPGPQPYCTRSRGSVDCWTAPPEGAPLRGVGDPGW